jgi:hypothetical protein
VVASHVKGKNENFRKNFCRLWVYRLTGWLVGGIFAAATRPRAAAVCGFWSAAKTIKQLFAKRDQE